MATTRSLVNTKSITAGNSAKYPGFAALFSVFFRNFHFSLANRLAPTIFLLSLCF